jgi:hypothetical protein
MLYDSAGPQRSSTRVAVIVSIGSDGTQFCQVHYRRSTDEGANTSSPLLEVFRIHTNEYRFFLGKTPRYRDSFPHRAEWLIFASNGSAAQAPPPELPCLILTCTRAVRLKVYWIYPTPLMSSRKRAHIRNLESPLDWQPDFVQF